LSCAWNNYCIAINQKINATKIMAGMGQELIKKEKDNPELYMLGDMLIETALYFYLDGMVFERDNMITLIEEDMERNGDIWIYYLAQTLRDKRVFKWLKRRGTFDNIPEDELKQMEDGNYDGISKKQTSR